MQAFSRLKRVLSERQMSVPELQKRIQQRGAQANIKSLYRLSNERQPLERLDLRLAGEICQVCDVPLSELISFEAQERKLLTFTSSRQRQLDELMKRNNDSTLTDTESEQLRKLVREAEDMAIKNARMLAEQRLKLASSETSG